MNIITSEHSNITEIEAVKDHSLQSTIYLIKNDKMEIKDSTIPLNKVVVLNESIEYNVIYMIITGLSQLYPDTILFHVYFNTSDQRVLTGRYNKETNYVEITPEVPMEWVQVDFPIHSVE